MAHHLSKIMHHYMRRGILRTKSKVPIILQTMYYKSYGQGATTCTPKSEAQHKLYYTPYVRQCIVSHDEKNMTIGRPMSPHLDIYGPTVPAMTSIAQRATGIALSVLSFVLAAAELFYDGGTCAFIKLIQSVIKSLNIPEVVIIGLKAILSVVFLHHYFNGLRFVFFNFAMGLDIKTAYKTAWGGIVISLAAGVATALLGHMY